MGSWADLDLPAPVVRMSVAATAAVAAATAGNDHEHQNSNWKKKQRMVLHHVGVIIVEYPMSPPSCLVSSRMNKAWFLDDLFFALYPHLHPPKFLLPCICYPFHLDIHYWVFHDFKSYPPNHVGV